MKEYEVIHVLEDKMEKIYNYEFCDKGRLKESIIIDNSEGHHISLSIQGSFFHYCIPRQTLNFNEYNSLEVGIILSKDISISALFKNNLKLLDKLNEYYIDIEEDCTDVDLYVYGYVPVELINEIYLYLRGEYNG